MLTPIFLKLNSGDSMSWSSWNVFANVLFFSMTLYQRLSLERRRVHSLTMSACFERV